MEKKISIIILAVLLLAGCSAASSSQVGSTTTPSTTATTTKPLLKGWQESGGERYYYDNNGVMHTGWLELAGVKYFFNNAGIMQTGLTTIGENTYYFTDAGCCCAGWVQIDGADYYFGKDGVMGEGWLTEGEATYYLEYGQKVTDWQDIGENRYYFDAEGCLLTGWQEIEGQQYYFRPDGRMARGKVVFSDTETRYFTSTGKEVLLVNPWNYIPEDYTVELTKYSYSRSVATICYDPLMQMMADCSEATGHQVVLRSAFRTHDDQKYLYMNRVQLYLNKGYSQADAERIAATINAIPGTSEHELGLAVDLVDKEYQSLNKEQENTLVQKWLMEHCWEYGFILRYPNEKTDVTGIIYEPWHYRYVGVELAMELRDSGLCLEEYLDQLTQE